MFSFIFSTSLIENVERIEAIGESSPLPKSDANIIRRELLVALNSYL